MNTLKEKSGLHVDPVIEDRSKLNAYSAKVSSEHRVAAEARLEAMGKTLLDMGLRKVPQLAERTDVAGKAHIEQRLKVEEDTVGSGYLSNKQRQYHFSGEAVDNRKISEARAESTAGMHYYRNQGAYENMAINDAVEAGKTVTLQNPETGERKEFSQDNPTGVTLHDS